MSGGQEMPHLRGRNAIILKRSSKMNVEAAKIALWATIIGALIAGSALVLNDWLKRRWEKEKWIIDKKEEAFLQCLRLLSESRRIPKDQKYLEKGSYDGLMAAMPHVPALMIMMQCYSSNASAREIEPVCTEISNVVRELKAHEREITTVDGESYIREFGISRAIEDALPVVTECFKRELQDMRLWRSCGRRIEDRD
jgi:hypothetical protein